MFCMFFCDCFEGVELYKVNSLISMCLIFLLLVVLVLGGYLIESFGWCLSYLFLLFFVIVVVIIMMMSMVEILLVIVCKKEFVLCSYYYVLLDCCF